MLGWLKQTKLHFIGIGGIGMSGIAEVLLSYGYQVSGSDLNSSAVTKRLEEKGAKIFYEHVATNVENADLIIYSSAINHQNPEVIRAKELGIPLIRRAEMLAELMRLKYGIAVAGSHGKTTTTSIIASIFNVANLDATYIIGGIVHHLGGNAKKGDGQYLIAEADESDGSFLYLNPIMAALTNVDNDHLDHYGSVDKIKDAFCEFVNKVPFYGRVALNANDNPSVALKDQIKRTVVWYGFDCPEMQLEYEAKNIKLSASGSSFELHSNGKFVDVIETHLIGLHNISNTLAAIATCHETGIEWEAIKRGLSDFKGVGRRLEKIWENDSFIVFDDYGHHPTEVLATIKALQDVDDRPLTVVFEPHRYTRTQNFWEEFNDCFKNVDEVFISPIYAASEKPIEGISSEVLVESMRSRGYKASFISSLDEMKSLIQERQNQKRIFLSLGAGSISKKVREIAACL